MQLSNGKTPWTLSSSKDGSSVIKINLGCGGAYLEGWVNIDREHPAADLKQDLLDPLPFEENSVQFIYSEHLIEHLTYQEGLAVLRECRRMLKPAGVLRLATPDLDYLIRRYLLGWKKQDWIGRYGYDWIQTKAQMLNVCFYEWGHRYLYNEEELKRLLREAGFAKLSRRRLNVSSFKELQKLETRIDSKLILEAVKS